MTTTMAEPGSTAGRMIHSSPNRFHRQVLVELRKSTDTRSGIALLVINATLALVVIALSIVLARSIDQMSVSFAELAQRAGTATMMLLPVIGLIAITTEWSQRTTLTSFTLEPRRLQILAAKIVSSVIIALATAGFLLVMASVGTVVAAPLTDGAADWSVSAGPLAGLVAQQVIAVLSGVALGALILNTPAAIVAYVGYALVIPMLIPLAGLWQPLEKLAPWINFSAAQEALTGTMAATDWGQLAVSGGIWLVLPLVLGMIRINRSDIS